MKTIANISLVLSLARKKKWNVNGKLAHSTFKSTAVFSVKDNYSVVTFVHEEERSEGPSVVRRLSLRDAGTRPPAPSHQVLPSAGGGGKQSRASPCIP